MSTFTAAIADVRPLHAPSPPLSSPGRRLDTPSPGIPSFFYRQTTPTPDSAPALLSPSAPALPSPSAPALLFPSPSAPSEARPHWTLSVLWLVLVVAMASPLLIWARLSAAVARRRFVRQANLRDALHRLGLNPTAHPVEARLLSGGAANIVALVTVRPRNAPARRLVLKRPLFFGSLLAWGGVHLGPMPDVGAVGKGARQQRERAALLRLEREGIPAPRCLAWDPEAAILAMEWIEGTPFSELGATSQGVALAEAYGRTLASVHEARMALGDGHPGNALVDGRGRIVLVDLEHATGGDAATAERKAFDLVYAESFLTRPESRAALRRGYGVVPAGISTHLARQEQRLMSFAPFVGRLPHTTGR